MGGMLRVMPDRPVKLGFSLWSQVADWPSILTAARRIDRLGFDYLFTWDHLYATFGDPGQRIFEGWTLLAAIAGATKHAEVGLLVTANTFRNPALVAKMAVTVDHISAGRAVLGLGGAWFEAEHAAHGIPFGRSAGERLGWLDEAAGHLRRLIDGETVDAAKTTYHLAGAHHEPRPLRTHLPILIGGSGERRTLRTTAKVADIWNALGSVERLRHLSSILDEHCAAVGRDPAAIERSVTCKMVIRDEPDDARRTWEAALAANRTRLDIEPDPWLGPPERIAERIAAYRAIGVTTVIASIPFPYDAETIDRLATDVRPMLA